MSDTPPTMTNLASRVPVGDEFNGFAVFVVGGAVRDALRGLSPSDIDLLVVPRPSDVSDPVSVLENRMKKRVNPESSFPVFIDHRGREIALPRTEERLDDENAVIDADDIHLVPPGTPVGEAVRTDLERRDLTVNAMAVNAREPELIDPFGGERDLRNSVVRHVSEGFRDDPLRVVRLARFAARLEADVAPETLEIAREVSPALDAIPVERVTNEARKTFKQAPRPARFFRVLKRVGALGHTFPSLAGMTVEARHRFHAHLRAMNDVVGRDHRLGFAAVAMGLGPGRRDVFMQVQNLFNGEIWAMNQATRFVPVAHPDTTAERVVDMAESLRDGRGLSAAEMVAAGSARARAEGRQFDAESVRERLRVAFRGIHEIDGEVVMNRHNIQPGKDVSGEAFGRLISRERASFVRERV